MNWEQLIAIARELATAPSYGEARGRPQQARLRKAVSAAYYAMFHAQAGSNADALIGASPQLRRLPAWTQIYRALDHGFARRQIRPGLSGFALAIQDFGAAFIVIQDERHKADYGPNAEFNRSETLRLINRAESAIIAFMNADPTERKAFAAHALFRARAS